MPVNRNEQTALSFDSYLGSRGLVYEAAIKADLLASILSSQFVLFAGPSGTGKSTAALALGDFFAPSSRRATIAVERTWETPQDVVGAYSSFAGYYLAKPGLDQLMRAQLTAGADAASDEARTPIIVVEEANLSAIEGYLNPVIHGLSMPAREAIDWPLHPLAGPAARSGETGAPAVVPAQMRLGPWPRFLGTINVDHTAMAPARKVSGRACVVLLEPSASPSALDGVAALFEPATTTDRDTGPQQLLHDPRTELAAILENGRLAELASALDAVTARLADKLGSNPVSKRDEHRCLLYMSWFCELAPFVPDLDGSELDAKAAENALLHFVLPALTPQQFGQTVDLFRTSTVDSLLRSRCERLVPAEGDAALGYAVDYWSALS